MEGEILACVVLSSDCVLKIANKLKRDLTFQHRSSTQCMPMFVSPIMDVSFTLDEIEERDIEVRCLRETGRNACPCCSVGRQGGRVVRVLDFESVGPGFESHSEHFMDLFHGSPEL